MTEGPAKSCQAARAEFRLGEWRVQPDLNRISSQELSYQIEPRLMDVLCDLAQHHREVRSREALLDAVWGAETFVSEEVLSRAISELRRLLQDSAVGSQYIETIRGRGYRLIADLSLEGNEEGAANPLETLAVLPFTDLSEGRAESHFAFGVTEALTSQLARLGTLRVISRTSAMCFLDADLSVPEIAGQLGADAIVEGSVVREGDGVSLTVQLIDAQTDHHIWANTYDGEIRGILSLYRQAAKEVSRRLKGQAPSVDLAVRTLSVEAYDAYSRGRYLWQQGTRDGLDKSIAAFRDAFAADPSYAEAYAGLADSFILMGLYEMLPPDTAYRQARRWTLEALALDPDLGEAHTALGAIRLFYEWDFKRSEMSFLRALELNPNHSIAYLAYRDLLTIRGRQDEALTAAQEAVRLDPLNPILVKVLADSLHNVGRTDEALQLFDRLIETHPRFLPGYSHQAEIWLSSGQPDEARRVIAQAEEEFSSPVGGEEAFAVVQAQLGDTAPARRVLESLADSADYISAGRRARIHIALGELDQAFEWLHRDVDERGTHVLWCGAGRFSEPLKGDPRLEALLERVHL